MELVVADLATCLDDKNIDDDDDDDDDHHHHHHHH
jgi:hypothetical protein